MKTLKIIISVLLCITLVACGTEKAEQSEGKYLEYREDFTLNYPLFDGEKVIENASITVKDSMIASVTEGECANSNYLLMPGLIDAHTHISTENQTEIMLKNGITATCDVSAPNSLIENSKQFTVISSAGMTMGTLSGKNYVKTALQNGAKYIKVLLMEPNLMLKSILKDICTSAHESGIKVAVHAVSLKAVRMAVDCGADILIHVPMKEKFPEELAEKIAQKGIAVAPTLIMMKTFGEDGRNGYKPEHYKNAENAVRLLHEYGVQILAATDANTGSYAPAVEYGPSLHTEMQLLVNAGLTPSEALMSATSNVARAFNISEIGTVSEGKRAVLLLIEGRPDKEITETAKIKQIWIDGEPIL